MRFYDNIYTCDEIKDRQQIIELIENKVNIYDVFVIYIIKDSKSVFEISNINNFLKRDVEKQGVIIGLANTKEKAIQIVIRIIEENIQNIFNLKKNFL